VEKMKKKSERGGKDRGGGDEGGKRGDRKE
jgi:hypothetical protein